MHTSRFQQSNAHSVPGLLGSRARSLISWMSLPTGIITTPACALHKDGHKLRLAWPDPSINSERIQQKQIVYHPKASS
jgi:hypothetical protein